MITETRPEYFKPHVKINNAKRLAPFTQRRFYKNVRSSTIMFNALNRFISRLDSDSPSQNSNHGAFGFQVLRNKSLELAIEPWFDFIVGINGRMIVLLLLPLVFCLLTISKDDSDPSLFAQEVRNCAGSTVTLGLWSAKARNTSGRNFLGALLTFFKGTTDKNHPHSYPGKQPLAGTRSAVDLTLNSIKHMAYS